jgi:hypothetical protein
LSGRYKIVDYSEKPIIRHSANSVIALKKPEISVIDVNNLSIPDTSNSFLKVLHKRKINKAVEATETSAKLKKPFSVAPLTTNVSIKSSKVLFITSTWIRFKNVPVEMTIKDLLEFLNGLTIRSVYVCPCLYFVDDNNENNNKNDIRNSINNKEKVNLNFKEDTLRKFLDVYVEFEKRSGVELALLRHQEAITYKFYNKQNVKTTSIHKTNMENIATELVVWIEATCFRIVFARLCMSKSFESFLLLVCNTTFIPKKYFLLNPLELFNNFKFLMLEKKQRLQNNKNKQADVGDDDGATTAAAAANFSEKYNKEYFEYEFDPTIDDILENNDVFLHHEFFNFRVENGVDNNINSINNNNNNDNDNNNEDEIYLKGDENDEKQNEKEKLSSEIILMDLTEKINELNNLSVDLKFLALTKNSAKNDDQLVENSDINCAINDGDLTLNQDYDILLFSISHVAQLINIFSSIRVKLWNFNHFL